MPRPSRKRERTVRPEPLGAQRMTSMSLGTSTLVRSLKTGEKPWEKYRVWQGVVSVGSRRVPCTRQVTYLALDELGLDGGPRLGLGGVGEQVHDDGAAGDGLVDIEQVLAGDPAVLLGVLPRLAVLPDTNDDVEAVIAEVQALAVALGAVADEGKGVVLEVVLEVGVSARAIERWISIAIAIAMAMHWMGDSPGASPEASRHALEAQQGQHIGTRSRARARISSIP